MFADLAASRDVFSVTSAYATGEANYEDPQSPLRVHVAHVTPSFFRTMQVQPLLGRAFTAGDARSGAPLVAILSHAFWLRVFGGRSALGHTLPMGGKVFTVVGVMPPQFAFPAQSDLWVPMSDPIRLEALSVPMSGEVTPLARLAPDVSVHTAARRVADFWNQDASMISPADSASQRGFRQWMEQARGEGLVLSLRAELAGTSRNPAMVLFAATVLLLLIACANVANLLIAHGISRRHEFATRATLGASRARLAAERLTESMLLGLTGAVVGLAVATALLRIVSSILPPSLTALFAPHLDLRIVLFALGLGVVSALGFGLWPAMASARIDLAADLRAGSVQAGGGGRGSRIRALFVAGELGVSVLLVGAALAVLQQFARITAAETGIRSDGVGTLELSFGQDAGPTAQRLGTLNAILVRVSGTPGVVAAAVVSNLPAGDQGPSIGSILQGHAVQWAQCSGGYFKVMGIPLLAGRTFSVADDSLAPPVVVIDKALADSLWPGLDPIGRRLPFGRGGESTVVGLVGHVRPGGRVGSSFRSTMYFPIGQFTPRFVALVARASIPDEALLARMQAAVHAAAPSQPAFNIRTMHDVLRASLSTDRVHTQLISLFGALALLVAALGVYTVVAFAISQRRRAMAIRSALGASRARLVRSAARELLYVLGAGVTAGVALSWLAKRGVQPLLAQPLAPTTGAFLMGVAVVVVAAALAAYLPIRDAIRIDPMSVLREP